MYDRLYNLFDILHQLFQKAKFLFSYTLILKKLTIRTKLLCFINSCEQTCDFIAFL